MHILHIVQLYHQASGASRYFMEIGTRLARDGHQVTVLASDAFDLEHFWAAGKQRIDESEQYEGGVRVLRFPVRRAPGPPIVYPIIRRLMVELGRLGQPSVPILNRLATITPRLPDMERYLEQSPELRDIDFVHTTNITLDFAILPTVSWIRRRGLHHICTPFVHLGEPGNQQILRYYSMPHQIGLLRNCDAVATMTNLERNFLISRGVPTERIQTIGAGVTPAELTGGDAIRFRNTHKISGPIVLSIGTAAYDKGTVHVLEAMRHLWANGSTATWVQCGPLMGHFEQIYAGLSEAERARTRVLGYVSDTVRHDALAAADVYAQPSRTDSFGITYLEAWCYRVPVIGAWAGGVPDVIRHGVDGLLVPFGDVAALAKTINRLISDQELARAMGAVGAAHVQQNMTWDAVYERARRLYQK
jgi:glycosyltransferase involved in cell wall biosynthesis